VYEPPTGRDPRAESLAEQAKFVRRLARRLVRDDARADDLAQETLVAALEHSRRGERPSRAWLAGVVRNLWRSGHRRESRRRRLERRLEVTSDASPHAGPDELAERLDRIREVVAELRALDRRYRDVIVLRYYDGLDPCEIAERLGAPRATVRTWLHRGLADLRRRLDRRYGDRGTWCALLLPLAGIDSVTRGLVPAAGPAATGAVIVSTTSKLVATFLIVASLLALALFLLRPRTALEEAPRRLADPSGAVRALPARPAPRKEDSSLAAPQVGADPPDRASEPAASPALAAAARPVSGRLQVIDDLGTRHEDALARFELEVETPRGLETRTVEVTLGFFEIVAAPGAELRLGEIEVARRPATFEAERAVVPEEGALTLVARCPGVTTLRVLDATTRAELDRVDVYRDIDVVSSDHPGSLEGLEVIAKSQPSPIVLSRFGGTRSYYVDAPGYAVVPVRVDFTSAGARVVELAREASLVVEFQNLDPASGTRVRLWATEEDRYLDAEATSARMTFDSLVPGRYEARAEIGAIDNDPLVLARAPVKLVAGRESTVRLELEEVASPGDPVPLGGSILFDDVWDADRFEIRVEPDDRRLEGRQKEVTLRRSDLRDAEPLSDGRSRVEWSAGDLFPGRYRVVLLPAQVIRELELVPPGDTDVRLELGEACTLRLRLVDADSGDAIPEGTVFWGPQGKRSAASAEADEDGRLEIRTVPGELAVMTHISGYRGKRGSYLLEPGTIERELLVPRGFGLRVRLLDGEAVIPIDPWRLRVEPADAGTGKANAWSWDSAEGSKILVTEPGVYRVEVPEIDGFAPVAPVTAVVPRGEIVDVEIPLVRLR